MLFMQPWMALVAFLLLCPQVFFIPFLQEAINRRTKRRIKTLRALSVDIVNETADQAGVREKTYRRRVGDVYRLNMQILRRKFVMNFLMNLLIIWASSASFPSVAGCCFTARPSWARSWRLFPGLTE